MFFDAGAEAYQGFMGRFSEPLAPLFADASGIGAGDRVLDVGCGPGALTAVLVERLGAAAVSAVDPVPAFVDAVSSRLPGVRAVAAPAEALPFDGDSFDAVLAQLVVHFLDDPRAGLREMARVVRPGGTVAACVWDYEEGTGPLSVFWNTVHALDPSAPGEVNRAGARRGQLAALCAEAGLEVRLDTLLEVAVRHESFQAWWHPFTLGVGPAGAYVTGLMPGEHTRLRDALAERFPADGPFTTTSGAWTVVATRP